MYGVAMGTNEKANEVSAETADLEPITPSDGLQTDEQDDGAGGPIILFFILGLVVSLVIGWVVFPKLLYSSKKQPFDFNHALHNAEVDDGCESCHFFRDDGSYAGVPKLAQCVDCHEEQLGESEDERIFVEEYVAKDREVPWLIYACLLFACRPRQDGQHGLRHLPRPYWRIRDFKSLPGEPHQRIQH
jgi:hypothetical protein